MRRAPIWAAACLVGVAALLGRPASVDAQEMDNAIFHFSQLQIDATRVEEAGLGRWSGNGWIGTDFDRLWWSTEGEASRDALGSAEAMALYGHYFRRFWDVVVGYRQDFEPVQQGYLAFGVMGLAPYWFEVGAFGFVSHRGEPSFRFEAETDLFLTQRLVFSPGGEVDWLITDDEQLGLDSGISDLEVGVRTRYEIRRKFAPYLDLLWVREKEAIMGGTSFIESGFRLGVGLRLIY